MVRPINLEALHTSDGTLIPTTTTARKLGNCSLSFTVLRLMIFIFFIHWSIGNSGTAKRLSCGQNRIIIL